VRDEARGVTRHDKRVRSIDATIERNAAIVRDICARYCFRGKCMANATQARKEYRMHHDAL